MRKKRTNFETRPEAGGIGRRSGKQRMMSRRKEKVGRVASGSGGLEWRAGRMVGYTSLILLGLVMLGILFPLVPASSHAEEVGMERVGMEGQTATEFSSYVHTDIKSYVRSSIALSITGQVNLDLIPKAQGAFSTESAKLSVSTNNVSGYSVYLAMVDSQTNSLLPMNTRSTEEIMATPAVLTAENYQSYLNTWGYKVAGDVGYQAVPRTAGAPIITAGTSSQTAEYDLSFAVAVGADLPAGVYGNQVLVSTIANPIEIRGINDITFMQEMTSDICLVSFENETKQLIDTRDGKSYWVAKLKDGNCWMVQNLALDITEDGLKASDTDIEEDWNQGSTYPPKATNAVEFLGQSVEASSADANSWNLGKIVLGTPLARKTCSNYPGDGHSSIIFGDNLGEKCRSSGFVDVSGGDWNDTMTAKGGNFDGSEQALVAVDETNKVYDAHYLIGNYYSWNASTAGTGYGIATENQNAPGSICPRGWQIPVSGTSSDGRPIINPYQDRKSYYQLLLTYGYPDAADYTFAYNKPVTPLISPNENKPANLAAGPMYFVRSGSVSLYGGGYLRAAGFDAYNNTATVDTKEHSYSFGFNNSIVYPTSYEVMILGMPVRCVAR